MTDKAPAGVRVDDGVEQPTLAVRFDVPMSDLDIGALFGAHVGRLSEHLVAIGHSPAGPPYARYHEFGPERADIEFGLPVAAPLADVPPLDDCPAGEIGATILPGGPRAVTTHVGAYPELGRSYRRLESWLTEHDRKGGGAPWESYVVMPDAVDGDPSRLRTEVVWPLA
jgi:effector-binding domain-containing protein